MKRITFFILSIFCLTACNNELEQTEQPDIVPQIELTFPDAEEVDVYSRATDSECKIQTLWVLVFNSTKTTKLWTEKVIVNNIVKNGQAAQLLPQLKQMPEDGNVVVCIANVDIAITDTASLNYSNINTLFTVRKTGDHYYSGGDYLPMSGEFSWTSYNYTCPMERAVAKVQVQMGTSVSDVTTNFSAENVTFRIHNSGSDGQIMPDASFLGFSTTSARETKSFNLVQKNGAAENLTHAYIHEYSSATRTGIGSTNGTGVNNDVFDPDRQFIILEKNNNPGYTFYRLDFHNNANGFFLDTKRNSHYMFTINKVRSEGYTTWLQARDNPGSNIEYTIRIDDDFRYITSNGQYAIVSSMDTIKIPTAAQTYLVGSVRYQPSASMTTSLVTTVNSASISGSGFSLGGTLSTSGLDITAPYENIDISITAPAGTVTAPGAPAPASVTIKLGNITHIIPIIRE